MKIFVDYRASRHTDHDVLCQEPQCVTLYTKVPDSDKLGPLAFIDIDVTRDDDVENSSAILFNDISEMIKFKEKLEELINASSQS